MRVRRAGLGREDGEFRGKSGRAKAERDNRGEGTSSAAVAVSLASGFESGFAWGIGSGQACCGGHRRACDPVYRRRNEICRGGQRGRRNSRRGRAGRVSRTEGDGGDRLRHAGRTERGPIGAFRGAQAGQLFTGRNPGRNRSGAHDDFAQSGTAARAFPGRGAAVVSRPPAAGERRGSPRKNGTLAAGARGLGKGAVMALLMGDHRNRARNESMNQSESAVNKEAKTATRSFVTFALGGSRFALDSSLVKEVVMPARVYLFPHTLPSREGVLVRRGMAIPVCNVARAFGKGGPCSLYVIAQCSYAGGSHAVAIPVSGACELVQGERLEGTDEASPLAV